MAHELLPYYERELHFIRHMVGDFATLYPRIANRLQLQEGQSADPHVERLIQAFAFLTGRIQYKLDSDLPEITDALLGVLSPHYLAPIPSLSIAQCEVDPDRGRLANGYTIERGTVLDTQPVHGQTCRFRTCYPVTLWPLTVESATLETPDRYGPLPSSARAVIKLTLRCLGEMTFSELTLDRLRFFLHGENTLVYTLYELLFNNTCQVQLRPGTDSGAQRPIILSPDCLRAVGFGPDEELLPVSPRAFVGYRLLHEYFACPEKFLFWDLTELNRAVQAGFGQTMEVCIVLNRLPRLQQAISANTFRLGCTPIVNLFDRLAEPIPLTHTQSEYCVVPDVTHPDTTDVYAVNAVTGTSGTHASKHFAPFYSFRHRQARIQQPAFWHATRRPVSTVHGTGTEVLLSLVDLSFHPTVPDVECINVHITCTNQNLPAKMTLGGPQGDLYLLDEAPVSQIRCLKQPTEPIQPALRHGAQWRLISHLSLNYLSLSEGGCEALQEILRLYNFSDDPAIEQQIEGITQLTSCQRPMVIPGLGPMLGTEVTLELDEDQYVGSGVFLFASVLEAFFRHYASLNTYIKLRVKTRQRKEPFQQWTAKQGARSLV